MMALPTTWSFLGQDAEAEEELQNQTSGFAGLVALEFGTEV